MTDFRGRLIDTAARAESMHRQLWRNLDESGACSCGARLTGPIPSDEERHAAFDRHRAEAVIDALGISEVVREGAWFAVGANEHGVIVDGLTDTPVFRVACLEAPAIQTHDYSSDPETRHGL